MIHIIRGAIKKPATSLRIIEYFTNRNDLNGTLYLGYPLLSLSDYFIDLDAVLVTKENGLIVFDLIEGKNYSTRAETQDDIYNSFVAKLTRNKRLVQKRKLNISINVVTYAPLWSEYKESADFELVCNSNELDEFLANQKWDKNELYEPLVAALQAITTIKKYPKRDNIKNQESKAAKLKILESSIANLDNKQGEAVIETSDSVQRIRGLAGSGKTIVLALKVAYLHAKNPDWKIAVTFNTRSLKPQFTDLIRRFTFEHIQEEPDWNKIDIIQAWGSPVNTGIYYKVCKLHNIPFYNLLEARGVLNSREGEEFDIVCKKALDEIKEFKVLYDLVLVDEAQDFTNNFLNLCYEILPKDNKRLIYAYDELQNLKQSSMGTTEEIYGYDSDGKPRVVLDNEDGKPKQDIILQMCYRNPRQLLTIAHALGFGIYRNDGLVQLFKEPRLWKEIGYENEGEDFKAGKEVTLYRPSRTSPVFFDNYLNPKDILICSENLNNEFEQDEWILNNIIKNLKEDELRYQDIIIINSNPIKTQTQIANLRKLLYEKGIASHLVGKSTSPDEFILENRNSITFTSIYRAKGNEAAMVYIMNAQYLYSGFELAKKRNMLFTAITRSKAWVRLVGYGDNFVNLCEEIKKVVDNEYKLKFNYPTNEEIQRINLIHRDMSHSERKLISDKKMQVRELVDMIKSGKLYYEDFKDELEDLRSENDE